MFNLYIPLAFLTSLLFGDIILLTKYLLLFKKYHNNLLLNTDICYLPSI